jgi:hypothetical protein
MAVVDADYVTMQTTLRSHLANGTQPSGKDMVNFLKVLNDAVSRFGTGNTAQEAVRTDLATQIGVLTPFNAAHLLANSAADATAIAAVVTALTADSAAMLTGEISKPALVVNAGADG